MSLEFEWDPSKAEENLKKHRLGFDEALSVFADPSARIFDDPHHTGDEAREIIVGYSQRQRLLLVSFTERAPKVRIISARKATKRERQEYEQSAKAKFQKRP
ncbi:MAG: hypothetical protein A3H96_23070 [Acidobacteria bacterium RIFCSPLOWO2_02_FULL_67_36]|nr:MAG: hypothetical protein A3H96_23070 [Acidobacteria bacterium RIFCSPLOWO2_02_FULL_67_36]